MKNTNLIKILNTFTEKEMKDFEDFIRSPYFNKKTPVIKLFNYIKKFYPDFNSSKLGKEIVFKNMFPDKNYNYGSMKNIIFELQKLSEKFIVIYEISMDEFKINSTLVDTLGKRNLTLLSEKHLKELENSLIGNEIRDVDYFYKMHKLYELKQMQSFDSSKGNVHSRKQNSLPVFENSHISTEYLKKFYLLSSLRYYNKIITNKSLYDVSEISNECEKFIDHYSSDLKNYSLNLEVEFLKLNLGKLKDEEFLKLKEVILKGLYEEKAGDRIIYAYSIYLLNYCRTKNQTDKKFRIYAFEILKNLVANKNYDSENGFMNLVLTRNIILIATELLEFQWCEKFIENDLQRVHPDYRNSIIQFYNAKKNFFEGNFEKSLEYLSVMKNDDVFNKYYIKELAIINYYELKYFDLLFEQIDSYKKFLSNNSMFPDSYKIRVKLFLNYISDLGRAATGSKIDLQLLRKDIEQEKNLAYQNWLLTKLDKLK